MFGTDVGYMHDPDPTDEYLLLARAGVSPMAILAMLTTAPAAFWHVSDRRGRVAAGMDADVVVLDADPAVDPANFARVRCTLREGRPLYVGS
jgi:imidazolonepropionase-like amidohydrolase